MTEVDWIAFFRRPEIPAFNAKILEHPDADLPRLVFADWVEENCPHTPFVMALRRSIANPDIPEWVPNFSMVVRGYELRLWRGRLELGIDMTDPEFGDDWDMFVKAAVRSGWVGRYKLRGARYTAAGLPLSAHKWIEWLDFAGSGITSFWLMLTVQDGFPHLRTLDLRFMRIDEEDADRLADDPNFASLQQLYLTPSFVTDQAHTRLARSKYLPEHIRAQFRRPA